MLYLAAAKRPTVPELMKLLYKEVSHQWYQIGACLGIRTSDLEGFKQKHLSDPGRCFVDVLSRWVDCDDPPPTWDAMAEALEAVEREDIARKIVETKL